MSFFISAAQAQTTGGAQQGPGFEMLIMLAVFGLLALFASGLTFEILSTFGGKELVGQIWYLVLLGFWGVLVFFDRT